MFMVCCKFISNKLKENQNWGTEYCLFNLNKSYFHFQNHFDCWSLSFVSIFIYFLFKGSILKPSFDIESQNRDFPPPLKHKQTEQCLISSSYVTQILLIYNMPSDSFPADQRNSQCQSLHWPDLQPKKF